MKNQSNSSIYGTSSTVSTQCTNEQQWTKYHSKQGHGFAAEDANAMWEKIHGKSVNKVGLNNSLDVSIQQTPYFPLWKFFLVLREFKT